MADSDLYIFTISNLRTLELKHTNTIIKIAVVFVIALLVVGCASYNPYVKSDYVDTAVPKVDLVHSTFIVSGHNQNLETSTQIHQSLRQQFAKSPNISTLIMLGNLGAKSGFPDSSHLERRNQYNKIIQPALETVSSFSGKTIIVPGLNEWSNGRKKGLSSVSQLQYYLEEVTGKEDLVLPSDGCPGPVEVNLSNETVLLVLNTQWWFQAELSEEESNCAVKDKGSFIVALNDAIKRNYNKKIVVAGFHPLYSNGPSSGFYPAGKYFFPPVFGAIHASYKRLIGDPQDVSNPGYDSFTRSLEGIFKNHKDLIYLSAKEESFQYFKKSDVHIVVSGSVGGATAVAKGHGAEYAHGKSGFTRINQYSNNEVWLEFWSLNEGELKIEHKRKLYQWTPLLLVSEDNASQNFKGQFKTAKATDKLNKKRQKKGISGLNYRKEWSMDISGIEVIDISVEKGGLRPLKRGGGMQTRSLRLEDPTGKQWVLRSVEKFPANALPVELRGTFADDLITDQVSASHPYGALVIPPLAESVGVYHANPRLVYLPDDRSLGIYRQDFADGLYIFEERADDDLWKDDSSFGNPDDIISTLDLVEKVKKDADDRIDESHVIKSRLFDIVIGDWDRHDDQWRWSKFKNKEKYGEEVDLYRPIPRDRDQAFFLGDGQLIKFASHKWGQPKFQGFHEKIRDVEGLEFNARYFDRYFITESDWSVWEEEVLNIQKRLTDEVIENSVKSWPKEIYDLNGKVIIAKLKQRRDDLRIHARNFYEFLSKTVTVVATEKSDKVEVERMDNNMTRVTLYRVSKKKRKIKGKYYERIFNEAVTKEVRIYGLGGKDNFEVIGSETNKTKIRLIGGEGKDMFDISNGKKMLVYDNKTGTDIKSGGNARLHLSDKNEEINSYNRSEFQYNVASPTLFGGFNPDDGIFIGGGVSFTKHGFRKSPFKSKQTFLFDMAPKSSSFNFIFKGEYTHVVSKWDLTLDLSISEPSFADFFYGYGNGTEVDEDARDMDTQFYRARYSQVKFSPALRKRWNDDQHQFSVGGLYQRINVETGDNNQEGLNRFVFAYSELRLVENSFDLLDEDRDFYGGFLNYTFDNRDSKAVPTHGLKFNINGRFLRQIGDEEVLNHSQLSANLSAYASLGKTNRVIFATRIGGVVTSGDFEFYHAARLGGASNMRGHRRLRFAGQHSVYQNNDIRIKLFDVRNRLFHGPFGINLLADFGKVFADDLTGAIDRDDFHSTVGGGLWVAPFNSVAIGFDYSKSLSISEEDPILFVRFGFFF